MHRRLLWLALALAGASSAGPAFAQPAGAAPDSAAFFMNAPGDTAWHLEADRLTGSQGAEEALALEGVRLRHGGLLITGRTGRYFRARRVATLTGDVTIVDSTTTITADHGEYLRDEGLAILQGNVHIEDRGVVLTGEEARLWRDTGRLVLQGQTVAEDRGRTIHAQQLTYLRADSLLFAEGSVVAEDDSAGTVVTGRSLEYDRNTALSLVTGEPVLRLVERDSTRTQVFGDTLRFNTDTRVATADGHVRIVREEVEAQSDRGVFFQREGHAVLSGTPRAWDHEGTIEGDTLEIFLEAGALRELRVHGNARVRYRPSDPDKAGERNYAGGDQLSLYFTDEGVADRIRVDGHAHAEYFPGDADRARGAGMNVADATHILLYMQAGRADQVFLEGSARGIYRFGEEGAPPKEPAGTKSGRRPSAPMPPGALAPPAPADSLRLRPLGARFRDPTPPPAQPPIGAAAHTETLLVATPADTASADTAKVVTFAVADSAEAASFPEQVEYEAEKIEIHVPDDLIILSEKAVLRYRGMQLEASRVEFDTKEQFLTATGKPVLKDKDQSLVGNRMTYSLSLQKGTVYGGETEFENGFYWGDRVRRVDARTLQVAHGSYSTCDQITDPHYHFTSSEMRLFPGDKVVAKPVVFYIENIPVLALPFYVFPIKKERHSGFLVPDIEFGFSSSRGRFVRNMGYYLAPNDYTDMMLWGDYYEDNPRWIAYLQARYNLRYSLSGNIYSAFSREKTAGRRRWELQASHMQTLGNRFTLTARGDFVSDKTFRRDQGLSGVPIDETIDRNLRSDIALQKTWSWGSFSAAANRVEDLDAGQITQLTAPSVTFGLAQRTIGRKPDAYGQGGFLPVLSSVYYGFNASAVNSYQVSAGDTSGTRVFRQASQAQVSLRDQRRYLGALSLAPSIRYTQSWFDRDVLGNRSAMAAVWGAGLGASTTLYGTFSPHLGPLVGFRHVVRPSVTYSYQPQFTGLTHVDRLGIRRSRFESIGGITATGGTKVSSMSFSVGNSFEAKVRHGDQVRKLTNLADLNLSGSYNFLAHEQGQKHALSNISASLQTRPYQNLSLYVNTAYDPYRRDLSSLDARTSFSLTGQIWGSVEGGVRDAATTPENETTPEPRPERGTPNTSTPAHRGWQLNVTHSYTRGANPSDYRMELDFGLSFALTANWYIQYANHYDMRLHDLVSQSWNIHRDLHCWEASFERRVGAGITEYYFRINVKAIQEIQYERRGYQ